MTDFYAILRGAIDESGAQTADARATIYLRAWAALDAQFDSPEVDLPEEARKAQRAEMDKAIAKIEAEFGNPKGSLAAAEAEKAREVEGAEEPRETEDTRRATADEVLTGEGKPAAPGKGEAKGRPLNSLRTEARLEAEKDRKSRRSGRQVALFAVLAIVAALAAGLAWRWDDVREMTAGTVEQVTAMVPEAEKAAPEGPPSDLPAPLPEQGEKPVTMEDAQAKDAARTALEDPQEQARAAAAEKPQEQAQTAAAEEPQPPEPAQPAEQAPAEPAASEQASAEPASEPAAAAEAGGKSDRAPLAAGDDKDQDRVGAAGQAAAERGYLVLESDPPGQQDLRIPGTARWSVEGSGGSASLNIDVNIPERGEALRLTMRANRDEALPASHTIDLIYQGEAGDGPMAEVAGIMLISNSVEGAKPLRAAGALVVPGQFLLALRGGDVDRKENISRLLGAKWLAVRAAFEKGRHAVFVIEKGKTGAAALEAALDAWGDAQATAEMPASSGSEFPPHALAVAAKLIHL